MGRRDVELEAEVPSSKKKKDLEEAVTPSKKKKDLEETVTPTKKKKDLEEAVTQTKKKKSSKKRAASDPDLATSGSMIDISNDIGEVMDGVDVDDDLTEPTLGEKLETLNVVENDEAKTIENQESSPRTKPPTADSVNVLLKQALHADDKELLLNCLCTQDEKVITNSVSRLNPSDVLKLLNSLLPIVQSKGSILMSALPWLKSLLLQHATRIISQESSLIALNSLYQIIESRVSTLQPALQLSSLLTLHQGIVDDVVDDNGLLTPLVYEDKDESEEEEDSEDAMETDDDEDGKEVAATIEFSDFDESEGESD